MSNQTDDLTQKEMENLTAIAHELPYANVTMAEEAENCKNAFIARKKSKVALREQTLVCLELVYRVLVLTAEDKKARQEYLKAIGIEGLKGSSKLLNTILTVTVTGDRRYAQKLASGIRYALRKKVPVGGLRKFIKKIGSIRKWITASAKAKTAPEHEQVDVLRLTIGSADVSRSLNDAREKAERKGIPIFRSAKLKFTPGGQVECVKAWKKVVKDKKPQTERNLARSSGRPGRPLSLH